LVAANNQRLFSQQICSTLLLVKERLVPISETAMADTATETTVSLGSDLRIGRAGELFAMLESAADPVRVVLIDGSSVSKVDTAGIQALAVVIIRFRAAGTAWRWHNSSATLASAAKMLGLEDILGLQ
jgi:anti-anti-sigma regulatory factor